MCLVYQVKTSCFFSTHQSANVNESAYISLSDFSGAGVKWTNIYKAYLSNYYEKNSIANQAAADFREGEVSIEIADCYKVLAK